MLTISPFAGEYVATWKHHYQCAILHIQPNKPVILFVKFFLSKEISVTNALSYPFHFHLCKYLHMIAMTVEHFELVYKNNNFLTQYICLFCAVYNHSLSLSDFDFVPLSLLMLLSTCLHSYTTPANTKLQIVTHDKHSSATLRTPFLQWKKFAKCFFTFQMFQIQVQICSWIIITQQLYTYE